MGLQQRRANYWRNRDKIELIARESYRRKKKVKSGSTNVRKWKKSGSEGNNTPFKRDFR
jgi:hypothetical protein